MRVVAQVGGSNSRPHHQYPHGRGSLDADCLARVTSAQMSSGKVTGLAACIDQPLGVIKFALAEPMTLEDVAPATGSQCQNPLLSGFSGSGHRRQRPAPDRRAWPSPWTATAAPGEKSVNDCGSNRHDITARFRCRHGAMDFFCCRASALQWLWRCTCRYARQRPRRYLPRSTC